jgi:hypothetical protein
VGAHDAPLDLLGEEPFHRDCPPVPYPAHPEAKERVLAILEAVLAEVRATLDGGERIEHFDGRYQLLWPVLSAALPEVRAGTRAGWFEGSLPALLGEVRVGAVVVSFPGAKVSPDPRHFGSLELTMRLTVLEDGQVVDVQEQELSAGSIAVEDLSLEAPDSSHPHVRGAIERWREAVAEKLRSSSEPGALVMDALPGEIGLPALITTWLEQGPPGPRPERLKPDASKPIRPVDRERYAAIDDAVLAAYEVGGWHVLLAPHVSRPDTFDADRLWVVPPSGEPALVLMSDPWNAPVAMTVDGDAVAFRGFATWLRELILRAELDVEWTESDEDESDDEDEGEGDDGNDEPQVRTRRLSDWLRFRDGWREEQGERLWDWRLQYEMVAEGPAFWQSGIYGFTPERKRELERGVATWHRFLREVVDPSFEGRRPD